MHGLDTRNDPILLERVDCSGNESDISSCPTSPIGQIVNPVCRESNRAAGVRCTIRSGICVNDQTRLVDGPGFYEGRLEVCVNNQWMTVCDAGFNMAAAVFVCNEGLYLDGSMHLE